MDKWQEWAETQNKFKQFFENKNGHLIATVSKPPTVSPGQTEITAASPEPLPNWSNGTETVTFRPTKPPVSL